MTSRRKRVMDTYIKTYYEGKTPERVAYELGVSSQTVKIYLREIECNIENYEMEKKIEDIACLIAIMLIVLVFIYVFF